MIILQEFNLEIYKDIFLQYSFNDLIYKNKLKFDFYLPDYNLLIEFDGPQHYEKESYYFEEKNSIRDNLKENYCKKNKIHLIRFINNHKDLNFKKLELIRETLYHYFYLEKSSTTNLIERIKLF